MSPERPVILLVEDDENDSELVLRALSKIGFASRVFRVRDGEEALDFLFGRGSFAGTAGAEGLRLILLDLKLPKVDGLEVLETVRAEPLTRGIPVVMLTSSMLPADIRACLRAGANSYVVKPVEYASHAAAVRRVVQYWMESNVLP